MECKTILGQYPKYASYANEGEPGRGEAAVRTEVQASLIHHPTPLCPTCRNGLP